MIQHMNMVFQASGLTVGEGAFLLACCNHTDDRGYVIASMQQLADEAHMKERTARDNKQRLIKHGLLAAAERYHPKTGARIADLYRVNLDLLGRMRRKRTDYGPTVIEELTFAVPEETAGQTPPADSAAPPRQIPPPPRQIPPPPPAVSAGTPPAETAPLLLPSQNPSSLSGPGGPSGDGSEPERERESEASPVDKRQAPAAPEGQQPEVERVVAAYAAAAGRPVINGTRVRLRSAAAELLAAGLPAGWLADRAAEMPSRGWTDLERHVERSTVPIPGQQTAEKPSSGLPTWCGQCGDGGLNQAARTSARWRTLGDGGTGDLCPDCHPERVSAGA
ncbi:helix-turn-helix domain-containing protein (plasmid) [Streptomyces sp. NBC_01725]|uniref:hypothetical protein n=1 Tax=Streptomyces sp. NBC_01725 TaxID=2975923 RepID=UPI002E2E6F41|nr:hypothetical protein [Streptomyces sp. NBC_01725]